MKYYLLIAALFLTACNSQKRQIRQLDGLVLQQPVEFSRLSNLINPCFTGKAKSDTVIVKGKIDTVIAPGSTNTIITHVKDTVFITKTIQLPGKVITKQGDKVIVHDTIPDTRKEGAILAQMQAYKEQSIADNTKLTDAQSSSSHRLYWIIGLAIGLLVSVVALIYFKI